MLHALVSDPQPVDGDDSSVCAPGAMPHVGRREHTRLLFEDRLTETDDIRRKLLFDEIVEINMRVSRSIAHRYRDRGESVEDLEQVAYFGLLKAVGRFDSSLGSDFLVYAVPTISGEVKRHFRDRCWVVKPPRRIQELKARIVGCTDMLSQVLGHSPRPLEIADYLEVSQCDVIEAICADSCYTPASLDITVGTAGIPTRGESIGETDAGFDRVEVRTLLRPLIRRLSRSDREIVSLRFCEQWTQERIAKHLGLSQMQVSRTLTRIMRKLRLEIGNDAIPACRASAR